MDPDRPGDSSAVAHTVDTAREAAARHAWQEAYDLLAAVDARGELPRSELELLASSAWWTGRLPEAIEIRERAFGAATKAGDITSAVEVAINLGRDHLLRNDYAAATAWLNRAERLLEGVPESIGHGFLAACRGFGYTLAGQNDAAMEEATKALDIAERVGDPNLIAYATSEKGHAMAVAGRVDEGLALIEEAMVSAVGGELDPATAGGVCCTSIETCTALGEYSRAATWTDAQDRWCRREGINGYPGMCRLFRSEIKQFRGSWLEAEAEARQASVELEGFMPAAAGSAFYRIGELRLLRGDVVGAEDALMRAHRLGVDAEPALSLVRLAQGRTDAAATGIRTALEEPGRMLSWRAPPGSPLHRLPLLRAQVEIALAAGDGGTARAAAGELADIAARFGGDHQIAVAAAADGAVLLAEGDASGAARALRRAIETWNGIAAPYEVAAARVVLADAYLATGASDQASMELQAARATFEQLGAGRDMHRADERLGRLLTEGAGGAPEAAAGERAVRTFAFTDIVDSTRLAEVLGDEAWTKLIRWHDQAIRAAIAEHGGEEIKATGDGFFLAFADPDAALDAMVAVQRRLAEHRDRQGFAPAVRIGVHTAEATRAGLDYIGVGVNTASRIGAMAEGGEILASAATLDTARRSSSNLARRTLRLRGLAEPIEAAAVPW